MRITSHHHIWLRRSQAGCLLRSGIKTPLWRVHGHDRRRFSTKDEHDSNEPQQKLLFTKHAAKDKEKDSAQKRKQHAGPASREPIVVRYYPENSPETEGSGTETQSLIRRISPNKKPRKDVPAKTILKHLHSLPTAHESRQEMFKELRLMNDLIRAYVPSQAVTEEFQLDPETPRKLQVCRDANSIRNWRRHAGIGKRNVGLVPTMGALHDGHLMLIRHAAQDTDEICVSIFVNPTQFGPTEDLATYPQTFDADLARLKQLNKELESEGKRGRITAVFAPTVDTMYPQGIDKETGVLQKHLSYVLVDPSMTSVLEGAARPTFFRGVATVVMKLFWYVQPTDAYFGQKDVQQLFVLERMVRDFGIPISIRPVAIERAENGLALSSRNAYLGVRRTHVATVLRQALAASEVALRKGSITRREVLRPALQTLSAELELQKSLSPDKRALFEIEYISMASSHTLQEVPDSNHAKRTIVSAVIVMLPLEDPSPTEKLGIDGDKKPVRLLDNFIWYPPRPKD